MTKQQGSIIKESINDYVDRMIKMNPDQKDYWENIRIKNNKQEIFKKKISKKFKIIDIPDKNFFVAVLDKTEFKDYTKLYDLETFKIVKKKDFKNYDYLGLISIQVSWSEFIFFDAYEYIEQKLDEIWKLPKWINLL